MKTSEITDPLFREALSSLESGDIPVLKNLLAEHPELVHQRLPNPDGGYFKDPYLLWFVADNPIRNGKLPANIVEVTRVIIEALKKQRLTNIDVQLEYTLSLVATGRIPKECGVQIGLMDLLIDEGATPAGLLAALANGNIVAAENLIKRGAKLTLAAAVGLDRMADVKRLASLASENELLIALATAGFYGNTEKIAYLLSIGVNPNGYTENSEGFHGHATPLHQAVSSGSIESVKLLVKAGASLNATDFFYNGTPLGWAEHMKADIGISEESRMKFAAIANYLNNIV